MFLAAGALTGSLAFGSSMAGCQSEGSGATSSSNAGGSGGTGTNAGGSGDTDSSSASAMGTGGSGTGGASVVAATIKDVTTAVIGPGVDVKLTGVVAMSRKFLVSQGSSSGSCLWGVFVSEPNLTETAPNSGILVLSYGFNATIADGGTKAFCPRLSIDPTGDSIPDDVKPGDVLDVVGETSYFLLPQCAEQKNGSTVSQYQISKASSVKKTGTAPVPAPHVLKTEAELVQLASPTDKAFHDQWGGVKVRIENVTSVPQTDAAMMPSITDKFGHIVVLGSNLQVGDKIYYRGYLKATNFCYDGPSYPPTTTFTAIEGFGYLDFCTWSLAPNDKCADLEPPSSDVDDCNGNALACVQ
jgi:hypothetical protein